MLVLCRKQNERIMIGDSVVVTVVRIDRNQVRIGIEAPRDVAVYREELVTARRQTNSPDEVLVPA